MKRTKQQIAAVGIGFIGLTALAVNSISFEEVIKKTAEVIGVFDFMPHPTLEKIESNESKNIMSIAGIMYKMQMATEPEKRDAHAKGHGCVQAEFNVVPDLAEKYRIGLFSKVGQKFDAIIRYSNGSGQSLDGNKQLKHDSVKDGRGMAVKVLNATDGKNLIETGATQDFMMIAGTKFFVASIRDYLQFQKSVSTTKSVKPFMVERTLREALAKAGIEDAETASESKLSPIINNMLVISTLTEKIESLEKQTPPPTKEELKKLNDALSKEKIYLAYNVTKTYPWDFLDALDAIKNAKTNGYPTELKILLETAKQIGSSLTESYSSLTSFLLKSPTGNPASDTAVKYISEPVNCATGAAIPATPVTNPESKSTNYLAEDLNAQLSESEKCFNFYIQPLPSNKTPSELIKLVEDPRLDYYPNGEANKILVATIKIPTQSVNTTARNNYCEKLSYNPWQALPEHQPLGALNRVRKVAVTASSIRRHFMANTERDEPSSIDAFKDLK